ncbi:hypothetical protein RND81_05G024900 [Saponaria officinalis]|uniref:Uncharacterized protein n=1 Tax=Saponaria officinalis TaxID=3572 RepID=A0AAW1KWS3_SAPOF
METQLNIDRMKEMDYHNAHSSRHYVLENGKTTSHLRDFDVAVVCDGVGIDDKKGAALCPITPISRRKNGKSVLVISTPLTLETPQSWTVEGFNTVSSDDDSPRTPEQGVFNPFAPGPERLCLAPLSKKLVKERTKVVARRLDFDHVYEPLSSFKDEDIRLENILFETVYETILESILLKQTEDFLAENHGLEFSGCCTPTSSHPLTGISDTCPGAPPKATTRKSVNVDPGLCRRLEF